MVRWTLAVLLVAYAKSQSNENDENSCPEVSIQHLDEDSYEAVVYYKLDYDSLGVWMQVQFDGKINLLTSGFGPVTSQDNSNFYIIDENFQLPKYVYKHVRFKVRFNAAVRRPQVQYLYINGVKRCPTEETFNLHFKDDALVEHSTIPFIDIED